MRNRIKTGRDVNELFRTVNLPQHSEYVQDIQSQAFNWKVDLLKPGAAWARLFMANAPLEYAPTGADARMEAPIIKLPNRAPVVAAGDQSFEGGVNVSAASLFRVIDADGDAIRGYRLTDLTVADNSGYWIVDGVAQVQGASFVVSADQLSRISFHTGAVGSDDLTIQAHDGKSWGAAADFTIETLNVAPIVQASDRSVARGASLDAKDVFKVIDSGQIEKYIISDSNVDATSGYWSINGVKQSGVFEVAAADFDHLRWTAGSSLDESIDNVSVKAFDGELWSDVVNFTLKTPANLLPTVETVGNLTLGSRQTVNASDLFINFTDPDGDNIVILGVIDYSPQDELSGYWTFKGEKMAVSYFNVPMSDLDELTFTTSSIAGSEELLDVRAYDGLGWGGYAHLTISVPASVIGHTDLLGL